MATEGSGHEDRPDDADDVDARFEEIVAGLRAEQAASQQRRREAIRRAQSRRRDEGPSSNRPLEGFDTPNPWPPRRRTPQSTDPRGTSPPGTNPPVTGSLGAPGAGAPPPGTNPPVTGPRGPQHTAHPGPPSSATPDRSAQPPSAAPHPPGQSPSATPSHRASGSGGRHRQQFGSAQDSDYPDAPGNYPETPSDAWRGWAGPDEEEHFIPPTPSLPAGDLHLWAIVAGLLGGPLILILSNVFTLLRAPWWTPVGILVSVAGVVLLVLRLPKNRDDTDFTGGAQV
ncbi:hypothetical protein MWU75_05970 [Ornithinimicrobium sp. F0845]|uniref:hypothetical protein n=1 Tax=Ornithinimicrobium sp. F0845 TaxID=2926412 RepID=UPI001FF29723|nr:hypothetical protein [Ornithinimicrobium sp. F0845]MCK0111681.1 hypothetical protein [Ornithinimicrobium sp. F0845]